MSGWYGFDLDGCTAHYEEWRGIEHIGAPIAPIVRMIQTLLMRGKEVRIFTARACEPKSIPYIEAWCEKHIGKKLPVTNVKDYGMIVLYDDRAIQVEENTGRIIAD